MRIELEFISDLTITKGNKTNTLVKNDKIKRIFDLDKIELEEYIDPRTGKHISKYCTVSMEDRYYKINKPYEELKSLMLNRTTPVIGFAAKSKKFKQC